MKLRSIFVEKMPPFGLIKDGDLWISHKHRTANLPAAFRIGYYIACGVTGSNCATPAAGQAADRLLLPFTSPVA